MKKLFFKEMTIIGRFFCVYNTCKTGIFQVYRFNNNTYFKPRKPAKLATSVNGVKNLVPCVQCVYNGLIVGYNEVNLKVA